MADAREVIDRFGGSSPTTIESATESEGTAAVLSRDLTELQKTGGSFGDFCKATANEWHRLARYLLRKWPTPAGVGVEDVEQELMVEAWRAFHRFDAERDNGKGIAGFVIWNATTHAKKWIHAQRGALRRSDKAQSRFPLAYSQVSETGDPSTDNRLAVDGSDVEACRNKVLAEVLERLQPSDREIVAEFVETAGDVDRVARWLWGSPDRRLDHRIGNEADARKIVRGAVRRALAAVGAERSAA